MDVYFHITHLTNDSKTIRSELEDILKNGGYREQSASEIIHTGVHYDIEANMSFLSSVRIIPSGVVFQRRGMDVILKNPSGNARAYLRSHRISKTHPISEANFSAYLRQPLGGKNGTFKQVDGFFKQMNHELHEQPDLNVMHYIWTANGPHRDLLAHVKKTLPTHFPARTMWTFF